MIDIELKNFYNNVKDPLWPEINNYLDFCKLPADIKNECYTVHNFQQRKNQIEDISYWNNLTTKVYQFQDLVYVPVAKCAHTYYTHLFSQMGWKERLLHEIDLSSSNAFGLLLHPFTRWSKGISEWVCSAGYYASIDAVSAHRALTPENELPVDYNKFKNDTNLHKLIKTAIIGDTHTVPYTVAFNKIIDQINWLPMDYFSSDNEIKISLMNFFNVVGHTVDIPLDNKRAWSASSDKIQLRNFINNLFLTDGRSIYELYKIYANDLKFYHNLVDKFDPQWSLINNTQAS
jgi:hypothetical protein